MMGVIIMLAALLLPAGPAAADLALVSTTPADGATITAPVTQVSLTFSAPGEPAGAGIVLLDQSGQPVPTQVGSPDGGVTWVATPETPLGSGQYGVDWRVAALDSHAATGTFRFTVAVPVVEDPVPTDAPAADAAEPPGPEEVDDVQGGAAEAARVDADGRALDELLEERGDTSTAQAVRWLGTTMMLAAALFGVGGLVFLALVMAGRRSEIRAAFTVVRWSAVVLIAGSIIQVAGRSTMRQDGDWSAGLSPSAIGDLLGSGSYGVSIGLRVLGALLILLGLRAADRKAPRAALGPSQDGDDRIVSASMRRSAPAVIGGGLYVVSFLFDGHTVTSEPRGLLWLSDAVHVLAAATWAGGIVMLAIVLWRRHRAHHAWDAAYLAVRFSVIAGASVVLAGIAGIGLTVGIIDEPAQLWATTWGQVLIAKVILVAIVAAIGAYNHYRLIPLLERTVDLRTGEHAMAGKGAPTGPGPVAEAEAPVVSTQARQHTTVADDGISRRLWLTASAEAVILLGVVGLTGWLINASAVG